MPKIDKKTLEKEVRALIAEIVEIEPEKITLEANFVENLGMDSMMALEIFATIEKKYNLKIPEDYLGKTSTLSSLIEIVEKILYKNE